MSQDIAIFGGSFNPPGLHHREIALALGRQFPEIAVVPCGPRPDKPVTADVPPLHRAAMADMTFRGCPNTRVELFDLEAGGFTPNQQLEQRLAASGRAWHVVAAAWLRGGAEGKAEIQTAWQGGQELWRRGSFAVVRSEGEEINDADLPPQHVILDVIAPSGRRIRDRVFNHEPIEGLVTPEVAEYISRHRLYRGGVGNRGMRMRLTRLRPLIFADERNEQAGQAARQLVEATKKEPAGEDDAPNLIVVVGGDGTMLHAIREHWRLRAPFYGVNTGHLGFLLNVDSPLDYLGRELVVAQVPLLYVETETLEGQTRTALAFNDAWVERQTGQTAWIQVQINGEQRLPQLVADGALLATAAGSTAYAHAMGGTPMPLGTPALLLAGSNVLRPRFWRPVVLPLDSEVELTSLDPEKRPLHGYIDGVSQGVVRAMRARVSNIAAAELVFTPGHDPAAKLARIQFPSPEEAG